MEFILPFIFPILSFFLQAYPRFFNKYFGVDVWTRLLEIDHIKKAGHKIPGKITKGFIIDGYFDYPPVFPFIFSFFSKEFLLKYQGFVSPLFDALQNVLVYYVAYSLTNNTSIALVAQTVYTLTPILPIENSYLTPRSLGYFVFTLAFYPQLLFHITHEPLLLVAGVVFTTLVFLTHRFALQSLLFISLFFTFVDKSPIYLAILFIGFLLAAALTKGYYLRVAKGHLCNIYFWVLNYQYRFSHQIYGLQKTKKQDWVGIIYSLLSTFSPLFLFGLDVWIAAGFVYFYLFHFTYTEIANPVLYKMSLWILFLYVLAAVVLKIKKLIPIGEGQRYLEMATVPSAILTSILFFHFYKQFGMFAIIFFGTMLFGNLVLIVAIQLKGVIKDKNRSLTIDLQKVYAFINKLPGTPRIICIPHQNTTMTVYNTKADVLVNADNPGLLRLSDFFPILKTPMEKLVEKYNLEYVLFRESFAKLEDLKIKNPKIVFKSGDILLIKLSS